MTLGMAFLAHQFTALVQTKTFQQLLNGLQFYCNNLGDIITKNLGEMSSLTCTLVQY